MPFPIMDGSPSTNVDGEHSYKARVTFGASTAFTARGAKNLTITRPSATTLKLAFMMPYAEVTSFHVGRKAAAAVAGLEFIITTNNCTDTTDPHVILTSIVAAGTATASASGDVAYIEIGLSSSKLEDGQLASG